MSWSDNATTEIASAMSADDAVPRSLGRAFDLLEFIAGSGEASLTEAASHASLTPTTALRHLRALEARGYLHRDVDGSFSAGPTLLRLAAMARDEGPYARLVAAAQPVLDHLTAVTGESSYVAVADGKRAVYLATSESTRSVRHVGWVGKSVPLDGTAVGEALTGAPGARVRSGTVEPDITAVTIGVPDAATIMAALSIIGPAHRMDEAAIEVATGALREAADRLAGRLGLGHAPEVVS
jgi:urocanate hydratase